MDKPTHESALASLSTRLSELEGTVRKQAGVIATLKKSHEVELRNLRIMVGKAVEVGRRNASVIRNAEEALSSIRSKQKI